MAHEIDRRIAELEAAFADLPAGSPQRRAKAAELAGARAARYVQHGGGDDDRLRAQALADEVLADPAATADERQRMSLLNVTLTMLVATPAAALLGHPRVDAEALRRTEEWTRTTDPAAAMAGIAALQEQLGKIPDVASLPPAVGQASPDARTHAAHGARGSPPPRTCAG